ncbi:MAG: NAD(P)/FAD-dependent oxidoreductase [Candidatus Methanofastidiosia archaeon]
MRDRAKIVIVGGGIVGLSLAYQLAKRGESDILILEKGYLTSGASGRCAGGVRQQFSTEENITLMRENVKLYEGLASELGYNIWFRQGGYLFLASTEKELEQLEKNIKLQRNLGVETRFLEPFEIKKLVPMIITKGILGGSFCKSDGILFPWPVIWGYHERLKELGVDILTFTEVNAFELNEKKIERVKTSRGDVSAEVVVNAAGAWSSQVANLCGLKLPNKPVRHESLVTEPLKPFLEPMIILLKESLYMEQTMRGEVLAGISDPEERITFEMSSSLEFMERLAQKVTKLIPNLRHVNVLRQWAGLYDITPDTRPILGACKIENFIQANGFMGHGFMMAPAITKKLSEWMLFGKHKKFVESYSLKRFEKGELEREAWIVG